jgi:hypothetical protein
MTACLLCLYCHVEMEILCGNGDLVWKWRPCLDRHHSKQSYQMSKRFTVTVINSKLKSFVVLICKAETYKNNYKPSNLKNQSF